MLMVYIETLKCNNPKVNKICRFLMSKIKAGTHQLYLNNRGKINQEMVVDAHEMRLDDLARRDLETLAVYCPNNLEIPKRKHLTKLIRANSITDTTKIVRQACAQSHKCSIWPALKGHKAKSNKTIEPLITDKSIKRSLAK